MLPALKSKDRFTQRASKEQAKVLMKSSSVQSNGGNCSPPDPYNPVLGTFHNLEIASSSLLTASHSDVRLSTACDREDHSGSSPGTTAEYDSLSNNDSCSGESEDQKEKPTGVALHKENIPSSDNDRREKNRQKNEKKHQRQKERRAQELHDRCTNFLLSRKVEVLSHQLVVMGFPADRAAMAIIINDGQMEESVAWLLHDGEECKYKVLVNLEDKTQWKIDITDELSRMAEMEIKYKCTKQEVERAVVACEGNLLIAEDNLKQQKQAVSVFATPKTDQSVDSIGLNHKVETPNLIKGASSGSIFQRRYDDRDLIYLKSAASVTLQQDSANKNLQQSLKRIPVDWSRAQAATVDKNFSTSTAPTVSFPLVSPATVVGPPSRLEPRFCATMCHEHCTNLQAGALRESLVIMQRAKQNFPSSTISMSISPSKSTGWYSSFGGILPSMNSNALQQIYPQGIPHPLSSGPLDMSESAGWSNHSWNPLGTASSLSLSTPSSLGLFTGYGSLASPALSNDWNRSSSLLHRDYTTIDWSLDLTPLSSSVKNETLSRAPTIFTGGNATRSTLVDGGVYIPGLHKGDGGCILTDH